MLSLDHVPHKPGCYLYKDAQGTIIYIGKAKDLKKRVRSYFQKDHTHVKTQALVDSITRVEYIITSSELEALLLESRLIKQHTPKYNIDLKHNQRYAYLKVTDEEVPRLLSVRKKTTDGTYFGPFVDGFSRALTQKTLNEAFGLRTCKVLPKTVCLQYHIGLCSGPCEGKVTRSEYQERVQQAKRYLKGDIQALLEQLSKEMQVFSAAQQFELAKMRRDQIQALKMLIQKQQVDLSKEFDQDFVSVSATQTQACYVVMPIIKGVMQQKAQYTIDLHTDLLSANEQFILRYYEDKIPPKEIILPSDFVEDVSLMQDVLSTKTPYKIQITLPQKGDKQQLLALAQTNADYGLSAQNSVLIALKERLHLSTIPQEIECYDISNLGDDYIVGAKIHFSAGKPNKDMYRRYRIRWHTGQNDFLAMYEVIKRRFMRVASKEEAAPDLVVIDGGKGQLMHAMKAMQELGLKIPTISLAKKEEEIFFPGLSKSLKTTKDKDIAIRLLMQIRDETHRFVISYHRHLRDGKPI
jgi:excinuclease ABC subunit C